MQVRIGRATGSFEDDSDSPPRHSAGAAWGAPFDKYPESAWVKLMAVNVTAVFNLTRALRPLLRAGGSADNASAVVNIGSIDGIRVSAVSHFAYSSSKAAVHMLTRKLSLEFADDNDPVSVCFPSPLI